MEKCRNRNITCLLCLWRVGYWGVMFHQLHRLEQGSLPMLRLSSGRSHTVEQSGPEEGNRRSCVCIARKWQRWKSFAKVWQFETLFRPTNCYKFKIADETSSNFIKNFKYAKTLGRENWFGEKVYRICLVYKANLWWANRDGETVTHYWATALVWRDYRERFKSNPGCPIKFGWDELFIFIL